MNFYIFVTIIIYFVYLLIITLEVRLIEFENNYDNRQWMSYLNDDILLKSVFIPGATNYQVVDIKKLLKNGVRSFYNVSKDELRVLKNYLKMYSSEFIIIYSDDASKCVDLNISIKNIRGLLLYSNKMLLFNRGYHFTPKLSARDCFNKIVRLHDIHHILLIPYCHYNNWICTNYIISRNNVKIKRYIILF